MIRVGSLWTHKDKNGKTFLSGSLDLTTLPFEKESVSVFIFTNKYCKKGTKLPNLQIFIPDDEANTEKDEPRESSNTNGDKDTYENNPFA